VQQVAPVPGPRGSITRIRGRGALGSEAPLRAVIENGERLLVCASVSLADVPYSQPLWLTDLRFLFTRRHSGYGKLVVSVPVDGCTLDYDPAAPYPLRLSWTDEDGSPRRESFRRGTWRDSLDSGRAGVTGGATGGIEGAIFGGAVDAVVHAVARNHRSASADQSLHSILTAAIHAPGQVQPVDLTTDSLNRIGTRLALGIFMGFVTTLVLAAAIYCAVSYSTKLAYDAAPLCGSVAAADCRSRQAAVVTAFRGAHESFDTMYCDLTMSKADGASLTVHLLAFNLCGDNPVGQEMTLEYWRGSVVAVIAPGVSDPLDREPQETPLTPGYNWRAGAILTGLFTVLWLAFGAVALAELSRWRKRRSLLQASARAAGYLA
jgi:hypothetical protein